MNDEEFTETSNKFKQYIEYLEKRNSRVKKDNQKDRMSIVNPQSITERSSSASIRHAPMNNYGQAKSFFENCEDQEAMRHIWEW